MDPGIVELELVFIRARLSVLVFVRVDLQFYADNHLEQIQINYANDSHRYKQVMTFSSCYLVFEKIYL